MANLFKNSFITKRVAYDYNQVKYYLSKIQKSSASIGFVSCCIYNEIIPVFAKVKGKFTKRKEQ